MGDGNAPGWKLRLAPSIGYPTFDAPFFKESVGSVDPVDQIHYLHDLGFAGIEDTYLKKRPERDQARVGEALARTGMAIGAFVNNTESTRLPLLVSRDKEAREQLFKELLSSIETAKRSGAKYLTTVSARDPSIPLAFQFAIAIDNLRFLAETAEKAGVVICVEPVNGVRMPGMLMHRVGDAYLLAKAVNSPAVKMVADIVHFQMAEPSIVSTLEQCWDQIATIQAADTPLRTELGSGEVNYVTVFRFLRDRGYQGLIGLEYNLATPGLANEQAALAKLRQINAEI